MALVVQTAPYITVYGAGYLVGAGMYRTDLFLDLQNYTPTDVLVTLTTSNGNITTQSTVTVLANSYPRAYFRVASHLLPRPAPLH